MSSFAVQLGRTMTPDEAADAMRALMLQRADLIKKTAKA